MRRGVGEGANREVTEPRGDQIRPRGLVNRPDLP